MQFYNSHDMHNLAKPTPVSAKFRLNDRWILAKMYRKNIGVNLISWSQNVTSKTLGFHLHVGRYSPTTLRTQCYEYYLQIAVFISQLSAIKHFKNVIHMSLSMYVLSMINLEAAVLRLTFELRSPVHLSKLSVDSQVLTNSYLYIRILTLETYWPIS